MSWRDADKTPVLGRIFSEHLEERLGPHATGRRSGRAKTHRIWPRRCKRASKKCCSKSSTRCTPARSRKSLCLAGGVAFNCVANGKIFERTPFERVFVQPAAGDAGLAIGAAYYVHHQVLGQPARFRDGTLLLGPGLFPGADSLGDRAKPPGRQRRGNLGASGGRNRASRGPANRRRKHPRLVRRPRRVGSARAGESQHRGRSAARGNERDPESPDQASRNVPALCSFDSRRMHRRIFRDSLIRRHS